MKNRLLIIGLVFLCMITSVFSLTLQDDLTFQSQDSNVKIQFDEDIKVDSITIGSSSLLLTNMVIPSCPMQTQTKNITTIGTTLSSTFSDSYCVASGGIGGVSFVEDNETSFITITDSLLTSFSEINFTSIISDFSEMYFFGESNSDNKFINILDKVFTVLGLSIILGILCTLLIFNIDSNSDWVGGSFINFISRTGLSIIITIIVTVLLWVLHITLN